MKKINELKFALEGMMEKEKYVEKLKNAYKKHRINDYKRYEAVCEVLSCMDNKECIYALVRCKQHIQNCELMSKYVGVLGAAISLYMFVKSVTNTEKAVFLSPELLLFVCVGSGAILLSYVLFLMFKVKYEYLTEVLELHTLK